MYDRTVDVPRLLFFTNRYGEHSRCCPTRRSPCRDALDAHYASISVRAVRDGGTVASNLLLTRAPLPVTAGQRRRAGYPIGRVSTEDKMVCIVCRVGDAMPLLAAARSSSLNRSLQPGTDGSLICHDGLQLPAFRFAHTPVPKTLRSPPPCLGHLPVPSPLPYSVLASARLAAGDLSDKLARRARSVAVSPGSLRPISTCDYRPQRRDEISERTSPGVVVRAG